MSTIVELRDYQFKKKAVFFRQEEMNELLSLFASRTKTGEWCDYAIEQRNGIIAFSVFSNMYDAPEFTIAKCSKPPRGGQGQYLLLNGPEKIRQSDSLTEILLEFKREEKTNFISLVKA